MHRILFILCFLISGSLFSQTFTGTVMDAKKRKALPDCIVIIRGTTASSLTDHKGNFTLSLPFNETSVLVFTMLGYTTIEYDLSTYKKDTFILTPKNIQLKEVEILAEKKAILNPGNDEKILDFDLLNDNILLLAPGKEMNNLKLLNELGNYVSSLNVNKHSESLKRDCLGNLQLYSKDSAWQVFFDFEKLNLLNPYSLDAYKSIMGKCICAGNNSFYFQDMEYRNLKTRYFYFSEKEKGIKHELIAFGDTAKIQAFELDYNLHYFLEVRRKSGYTMYNEPVDSIRVKMQKYREELPLDWTYNTWLGKIETEIVKNDTSLFIVNFTDSLIYSVTKDNAVRVQSAFHIAGYKNLVHKIYTDADYNENYMVQFMDNTLVMIRFDIYSGKELSKTIIPGIPYLPEKIIIHSGKAYFIQKNLADQQSYKLIKYYLKA
jgi:hypothetical protein